MNWDLDEDDKDFEKDFEELGFMSKFLAIGFMLACLLLVVLWKLLKIGIICVCLYFALQFVRAHIAETRACTQAHTQHKE